MLYIYEKLYRNMSQFQFGQRQIKIQNIFSSEIPYDVTILFAFANFLKRMVLVRPCELLINGILKADQMLSSN